MNREWGLKFIVQPKKPGNEHNSPHKVSENRLNRKWCKDFTYLFLDSHEVRYNCTIIDLHDRSVAAGITERHITSGLAILILIKALESPPHMSEELILHSGRGSQYTLKALVEFCKKVNVT